MNKRKEKLRRRQPPRETGTMTGRLRMARNGAGFLVDPETDKAVWIEERDLGTALPDDTVTIKLKGAGDEGVLLRIDARAPRSIVGTITAVGRFTRVQPLNPAYRQEFTVPDAKGARAGDRVVMRLVRWESRHLAPEGEITDVIGPKDDPSLDTLAVMNDAHRQLYRNARLLAVGAVLLLLLSVAASVALRRLRRTRLRSCF